MTTAPHPLQLHPDKNRNDPDAASAFVRVARAYEVLKEEEARADYDYYLRNPHARCAPSCVPLRLA